MCYQERKLPAAVVGLLSFVTLALAVLMALLAIRFNNSGLTAELGTMDDYSNFAFSFLLGASAVAFLFACCGLFVCKIKRIGCTLCFGCFLFPVAIAITAFGFVLTGVSHSKEADLKEFCLRDPKALIPEG